MEVAAIAHFAAAKQVKENRDGAVKHRKGLFETALESGRTFLLPSDASGSGMRGGNVELSSITAIIGTSSRRSHSHPMADSLIVAVIDRGTRRRACILDVCVRGTPAVARGPLELNEELDVRDGNVANVVCREVGVRGRQAGGDILTERA